MSVATTLVLIGLIDQPLNGMLTIACNGGGCTQCGTYKFVVDDQATEIDTGNKFFDDHTATVFLCSFQRHNGLLPGGYIGGIAFAMIAINRFYHQLVSVFIDGI